MSSTTHTTETPSKPTPALRSPWVLAWIGLLVTVLAVNLTFVILAIRTNPGLVNANYYERGQEYERTMITRLARDPGWLMRADIPKPLTAGVEESIGLVLVDQAGQPVDVDEATFYAYRPSDVSRDFALPMTREGKGRYRVETSFPLIGVWDTLIAVKTGEDEYSVGERVNVARP
ncbi:FixH family protein [Thiocapsa rosea]|uniref:Nitrogen fixation protein FixH n=1 Tax=Thiocapsa rosea TaxID=69360 RepID=A0A495V8J9_9GAMM|nr:FixH family protein [Thiocapsa rosea]RKT45050.1 nitrogen fixation protein FixH [Thiocapsa rosea]